MDTNVLLSDVTSLTSFGDNDVVLPLAVLEELDCHKKRMDEVGRNARMICRSIDALRESGSIYEGVALASGGRLRVASLGAVDLAQLPPEFPSSKNDNLVVAVALGLKRCGADPIVVSKDINVRVKCDAIGLRAEDYKKQRAADNEEQLYNGILSTEDIDDELLATAWSEGSISIPPSLPIVYPNQIVVIPRGSRERATVMRRSGDVLRLVRDYRNVFGLTPRNKEQNFALELLLDDDVKLVTLTGAAGCGKSLIALAAGLQMTLGTSPKYDKLVVTRPIEPLGKDIGFLPGTLAEKMEPWIAPIKDNLEFLMGSKKTKGGKAGEAGFKKDPYVNMLFEEGKIEIEAVTYIRGRSIPNSYIIVDEAQNLTPHQIKTIITRSGENSKIVLTGDIQQIDVTYLDAVSNGLSYVVEKFKDNPLAGHVNLRKGERSALASAAAEIL